MKPKDTYPDQYPYSLGRSAETAFLDELGTVLDVALFRAGEIEEIAHEWESSGTIASRIPRRTYWDHEVAGATRLTAAIEGFVAAWARASLILYPTQKRSRGAHLRAALGIRDPGLSAPLDDRGLRNAWMHLDEDIDTWSVQREGQVEGSTIALDRQPWYQLAVKGSVRVVDMEQLLVAFPCRGIWSLRPYFHQANGLRGRVHLTKSSERWIVHRGIGGLAAGWGSSPMTVLVKALGADLDLRVTAETFPLAEQAFREAIDRVLSSGPDEEP